MKNYKDFIEESFKEDFKKQYKKVAVGVGLAAVAGLSSLKSNKKQLETLKSKLEKEQNPNIANQLRTQITNLEKSIAIKEKNLNSR